MNEPDLSLQLTPALVRRWALKAFVVGLQVGAFAAWGALQAQ